MVYASSSTSFEGMTLDIVQSVYWSRWLYVNSPWKWLLPLSRFPLVVLTWDVVAQQQEWQIDPGWIRQENGNNQEICLYLDFWMLSFLRNKELRVDTNNVIFKN
jgi:hypothetical protein